MANERNAAVAIFDYPNEAEAAIKELHRAGIDLKKLSIVGKDYHTEENVVGYYNAGDHDRTPTSPTSASGKRKQPLWRTNHE
jgi:hypothetical protein